MTEIRGFQGEFRFLSNFWEGDPFWAVGQKWETGEHFYQALKTNVPEEIDAIREASTPGKAKRLGAQATLRDNWENKRYNAMMTTVGFKFTYSPGMANALVSTGKARLVEENTWHDNYFGECVCETCESKGLFGMNQLGVILMKMRRDLNAWTDLTWL